MDDSHEDTAYDEAVGRNVQALRKARRLTQVQLAELLALKGMPVRQQTIVKIEKGERPLRLKEAHTIARVLEVDVDALTAAEPRTSDLTLALRAAANARVLARGIYEDSVAMLDHQEILRGLVGRGQERPFAGDIEEQAMRAFTYTPVDVAQAAMDARERGTEERWLPWHETE